MRVIAGSARGRRLDTVAGWSVRPTADRVKEALFSALGSRATLDGATVLDLFAGSGALGIEALSRGARHVTFVEQDRAARLVLARNLERCGFNDRATLLSVSVRRAVEDLGRRRALFDGALLDPPYGRGLAAATLTALGQSGLLAADAWVAAEHHVDDVLADRYGGLQLTASKRYGSTALTLYSNGGERET
ncbi:MAG: 16S rRNA (guanine(966)-N(2))-methyltransferase RsmD [Deltaproteobacteria bacterium]|nr:16S rRNA (guanine(966)-N(2))-methyltransferase RsmD [Deltaproteobacteria bacterium]